MEDDLENFNQNESNDYKNEESFELTADEIENEWPKFIAYYEKNIDKFKSEGFESLIDVIRHRLAYSWAYQYHDLGTEEIASTILNGSIGPVPEDGEELFKAMAEDYLTYDSFIEPYNLENEEENE